MSYIDGRSSYTNLVDGRCQREVNAGVIYSFGGVSMVIRGVNYYY